MNWTGRKIVEDPRIDHEDPRVRSAAESLHNNESLHLHLDIEDKVCVYCALRASRVVREMDAGGPAPQVINRPVFECPLHGLVFMDHGKGLCQFPQGCTAALRLSAPTSLMPAPIVDRPEWAGECSKPDCVRVFVNPAEPPGVGVHVHLDDGESLVDVLARATSEITAMLTAPA
jgi:hypothetical protein